MTTNTNPATKPNNACHTCDRRLTPANRADIKRGAGADYRYMCTHCYDESGLENEHADGYHDDEPNTACPACDAEAAAEVTEEAAIVTKAGNPRSARSHAECYAMGIHEKSREGRQACRDGKFNGQGTDND
jgi:hypothetical protein